MTVADDNVERSMVDDPTTTKLLDLPECVVTIAVVAGAVTVVDVATLEVMVEPSELVVVTSIVVGIVDVAGRDVGVVSAADSEEVGAEVGVGFAFDVGCEVGVVASVGEGVSACDVWLVALLVELGVSEVDAMVTLLVTPVPTTCLLFFGMIPSGMLSARIWAKRENMVAATAEPQRYQICGLTSPPLPAGGQPLPAR